MFSRYVCYTALFVLEKTVEHRVFRALTLRVAGANGYALDIINYLVYSQLYG